MSAASPSDAVASSGPQVVFNPNGSIPIGPYSQGIRCGSTLYCSGAVGLDPKTKQLVSSDVSDQADRALQNLGLVLDAGGSSFANVLKVTILLTDMAQFAAVNAVYAKYFPNNFPARSTFAVVGLPLNSLVEIECIAHIPSATSSSSSSSS